MIKSYCIIFAIDGIQWKEKLEVLHSNCTTY